VTRGSVPDLKLAEFDGQKYLSLETFRKNGQGVKTPVWFVRHDDAFYVYTLADSGKVKRLRNNPRVRIAVCGMRGDIRGPWRDATAALIEGDERRAADTLLNRKYFMKRIGNVFSAFRRRDRAMIKIRCA
jgi:PPOX class probable F420-dependent enzyme